ncbi:hypothetical protein [Pseudomonas sp.]|uniref:Vgb family protein n=1 Tax=Pseudomonas sp. TaxID=306 RepID=UPI003568B26B
MNRLLFLGLIVDGQGAAWVTDNGLNAIVRVDGADLGIEVFPLPASAARANLNTAVFDAQGRLWFTGQNGFYGRLDPATRQIEVWPAPLGRWAAGPRPLWHPATERAEKRRCPDQPWQRLSALDSRSPAQQLVPGRADSGA